MSIIKAFLLLALAMSLHIVFFIPVLIINTLRKIYRGESIDDYFMVCAGGLDQAGGSVLFAKLDWMVSSIAYQKAVINNSRHAVWFMKAIDWVALKLGDLPNHCKRSYEKEIESTK